MGLLHTIFFQNGYHPKEITWALQHVADNKRLRTEEGEEEIKDVAVIPYCSTASGQIGR